MERPSARVVIFGGTHGNEMTGIGLVNHWARHPDEVRRAGLEVVTMLSNPQAAARVVRYVDHDLNRCFLPGDLASSREGYEFARAREIVSSCGGEGLLAQSVLLDLHTTTSNMGPTIILTTLSDFNLRLAHEIVGRFPSVKVISNPLPRSESPFLNGLSPYGFCIEVGPVAQGTIDPRVVAQTRELVAAVLDYCASELTTQDAGVPRAPGTPRQPERQLDVYEYAEVVDYPRNADGSLAAMLHPERYGRDFVPVERGSPMFLSWSGEVLGRQEEGLYWPIFLGESAYVEKQTAMVLTRRMRITLSDTSTR